MGYHWMTTLASSTASADRPSIDTTRTLSIEIHTTYGRTLNRGLSSSYPRTGGNSQIGETSLFSTADRAKSTDYSSKDNPRILLAVISEGNLRMCKQIWTTASIFFCLKI
ncbi:hypothetical protein TNCV_4263371 [Trichonephila clavipes]|nr:hypothetical protein TNCV_4263371 [Trichonephila clavipes]